MATRLTCPCGTPLRGADDDELVAVTQAHLAAEHPDLHYDREQILFLAF